MSLDLKPIYKEIVENVFNRWTALKLAVEHGMGGSNGLEKAIEIIQYVTDSCLSHQNVGESDLVNLLEDIMDEEFETVCDDGSIQEVSFHLVKYLRLLRDGKLEEIKTEINQLPPCQMWIRPGNKITFIKSPDDSSSSESGESDEEMDQDMIISEGQNLAPSTSGSTMKMEEEDVVDPGWTVVKTKKRK